jgi:hypothetical protein
MSKELLTRIADRIDRTADRMRFSGRIADAEVCSQAASRIRHGVSIEHAKAIETDLITGMLAAVRTRLSALSGSGEYDTPAPPEIPEPTPDPTPGPTPSSGDNTGTDFAVSSGNEPATAQVPPTPAPQPDPTPTPQAGPTPDATPSPTPASNGDQSDGQAEDDQHFTLKDDSVTLTPEAESSVGDIADQYFEATGQSLTLTSGSRDSGDQAQAMLAKLQQGSDLSEYANSQAAGEIKQAYEQAKQEGKSDDDTVADMQAVIDTQVANGVFISNHLRDGAVDVRSYNMTPEQRQAFIDAVTQSTGKPPLVEGIPPHFHVDLGGGQDTH